MYNGNGSSTSIFINAGGATVPGVWYHVAAVYTGSNATLFVNGVGTTTPTNSPFVPNIDGPLTLGMRSDTNFPWSGSVDEVAIYPGVISATDVLLHYQTGTNASSPSPYNQLVQSRSPIIYLRLDESYTLPIATNSGSLSTSANGFYQPGATPGFPGVPFSGLGTSNNGCWFDGVGGFVDIPGANVNFTGSMTVSAWVQANPANSLFQTIVGKGDSSYRLSMDPFGYPRFNDGQGSGDVIGPDPIDDGLWHLAVGVHDDTTHTNYLYVDGLVVGQGGPSTVPGNSRDLWIGGAPDYFTYRLFDGVVDEVSLFTNALSADQALQMYNSAFYTPDPAPVPVVGIRPLGGQIQLMWSFGTLQSADEVAGPYVAVELQPVSPYTFTPPEVRKFYRAGTPSP